jgi:uroporphyrinogen decarboxylase
MMSSRERVLTALDHREPDRIPFDLGSVQVTGIHETAYRHLRRALGLPETAVNLCDTIQQLATINDDLAERLGIDFRGLYPLNSHNWGINEEDAGDRWVYHDEWGITHHRLKEEGLYYSIVEVPLPKFDITEEEVKNFSWPDMGASWRVAGLREQAQQFRAKGYVVVLKDAFAGIFEFAPARGWHGKPADHDEPG